MCATILSLPLEPAAIVSSRDKEQAVLTSLEDYQAMEESACLLEHRLVCKIENLSIIVIS